MYKVCASFTLGVLLHMILQLATAQHLVPRPAATSSSDPPINDDFHHDLQYVHANPSRIAPRKQHIL
jgi:hypothetical protein